VTKATVPEQTY